MIVDTACHNGGGVSQAGMETGDRPALVDIPKVSEVLLVVAKGQTGAANLDVLQGTLDLIWSRSYLSGASPGSRDRSRIE